MLVACRCFDSYKIDDSDEFSRVHMQRNNEINASDVVGLCLAIIPSGGDLDQIREFGGSFVRSFQIESELFSDYGSSRGRKWQQVEQQAKFILNEKEKR